MSKNKKSVAPVDSLEAIVLGDRPLQEFEALDVALRVAAEVAALHATGRIHRAIHTVGLDQQGRASLPSPPLSCDFGGPLVDVESCPPELQHEPVVTLPADIDRATHVLRERNLLMPAERVDVYQLGALLYRIITSQPVSSYLQSPKDKGNIGRQLQTIIDAALGYEPSTRLQTAGELIAALEGYRREPEGCSDTDRHVLDDSRDTGAPPSESGNGDGPHHRKGAEPAHADANLPFQQLAHYEVLERIGQGGMGDVYKAYERSLDRIVAIKVLPPEFARLPGFVDRFHAEATAVASITHPNVVQVHFIGDDQSHYFFAMQYVEGESLARLLQRRGRLAVDEALAIVEQVLAGLAAAHQQGIVHRDIKPGNILIDRAHRRALVADFGLVKSVGSGGKLTATGVVMGTVDYISPEQGRGRPVDARSDLYSVGVLLYQLLSGRLPFEADSPTAMIFQHVYEEPRPLTECGPGIPVGLARVVAKLMLKAPEDRHQSADAVLADLRAYRSGDTPPSLVQSEESAFVDVEVVDHSSKTSIVRAPQFDAVVPLSSELIEPPKTNLWIRVRDRMFGEFQAMTPQRAERLQNTQQQVHGAVAEYARRQQELSRLLQDAETARNELAHQLRLCRSAAEATAELIAKSDIIADETLQEKAEQERLVAELQALVAEQDEELESLRVTLAKVTATLLQLRSQRDHLNARLRIAQARVTLDGAKPARQSRRRFVLLGVFGIVALTTTIYGVVTSARYLGLGVGTRDDLSEVSDKLKRIGFGFLSFHDTHRMFAHPRIRDTKVLEPSLRSAPTGLSWRVHLLPYLEQGPLYERFHLDEPWDSPHNRTLIEHMPDVYRLGRDKGTSTRFQVLTGPGMLFGQQQAPRMRDVPDGARHTIMALVVGPGRAITWTKPDELVLDLDDPLASLGAIPGRYIASVTVDGRPLMLPSDIEATEFLAMATPNGKEVIDADRYRREFEESQYAILPSLLRRLTGQ